MGFAGDSPGEAIELHLFLCVVAQPVLHAQIDANDSMAGVLNVLKDGFAITARINNEIVGSLGIIRASFWYNHAAHFMTDRWFFTYSAFRAGGEHAGLRVGQIMLAEAHAIAAQAGLPMIINGHQKPRGTGVTFTRPRVLGTAARKQEMH